MITNNAIHPLEHEIVYRAIELFESQKFPATRINIEIEFKEAMSKPYSHAVKVAKELGKLHGTCNLRINTLSVMQDLNCMANELLCHEVAHILSIVESSNSGNSIKQHGLEWHHWFSNLTKSAVYDYEHETALMDFRGSILFSGGKFCVCGCSYSEMGKAVSLRSKGKLLELKSNQILCDICGMSYTAVPDSEIPKGLVDDIEFLKQISLQRVSNDV